MYKEVRSKARYVFYSEPPTWTITFDGKTLRGLKSKGFKYIHYLVKNKFRDFGHIDLEPIDGIPVLDTGQAEVDFTKNDYQSDKKGGKTIDAKAMIHGKAFKEIKQEFKDVNESLEDAKRGENLIEIEIAQEKYDEFEKYYYDYFTKHGRSKKFKTEQKNIRDKIAKNIKDALAEIDIHDVTAQKKIWNHFNDALGGLYSKSIAYRPNPDVDWHI
jgi:hypothetical protein